MLERKVDFIFTVQVKNANPNGDPLANNMPRTDTNGYGEISDVCIKRKIRNRMQDLGHEIFVQSQDRATDGFKSLQKRFENEFGKSKDEEVIHNTMCEKWIDVRSFGQVVTFNELSLGIRGPISISIAKSLEPVVVKTMQITRSVNGKEPTKGSKSSDTMGTKHFVEYGVYVVSGSVNSYFSEKTGFSESDLEILKESIKTLFVNDMSSARPEGSMEVKEIFWFEHSSKIGDIPSARIQELLLYDELDLDNTNPKYEDHQIRLDLEKLDEYKKLGLKCEIIEGM